MATSMVRECPRELIIKDGYLKHREPGIVNRWRHRYVVFRTSTAGKFIFTVYRDKPAIPSNEQTDVPLEEYGGLDVALKLEGEKHVFALITSRSTECFATEGPDQLEEWQSVLQEYLGLELVMNVEIPYKQKSLKVGRAQMRVRNTGFTITSMDSPPKCLGSWQILHIRKFGGTESFRFETGSKCPSGEYLYVIKPEDLRRMKEVFTDLSHHKPIFLNDRTGRRMTREHKILQQFKDRQRVGPRLSLQHSTPPMAASKQQLFRKVDSGFDLARPRSNAVTIEDQSPSTANNMKNSPSANDIHGYYNLPQQGTGEEAKKKTNSLSTTSVSANQDNLYYNRDAIELQLQQKQQKGSSDDSDSDSDNDFVDIKHIKDSNAAAGYYNLRDNPILAKAKLTEQPTYENYQPKYQSDSNQPTPADEQLYNNFEAIMQQAEIRNSNGSLNRASVNNTENVKQEPSLATAQESIKPSSETATTNSDSDSVDESFRNRTTSIVEHIMISADQSTRSCEDLLSSDQKLWKSEDKDTTAMDGNHSDSELINGPSLSRKKKLSLKTKPSESEDTHEDYDYPHRNMKSPNRMNEYDHLEINERGFGEVTLEESVPYMKYEDVNGNEKMVALHRPRLPDQSTITKSFQSRKTKSHIYEAVEVPEDGIERGHSPESPETTPTQFGKQDSYKRKVSLLGHDHSYELVSQQKSPSPPPSATSTESKTSSSFIKKTFAGITSPTKATSRRTKQPSPGPQTKPPGPQTKSPGPQSKSLGPQSKTPAPQTKAPAVPPPTSDYNQSSPLSSRANIKKPIPTPRNVMTGTSSYPTPDSMYVNGAVIKQQVTALENQSLIGNRESAYVNGSVIKEQINALENRESTYVNGNVIKDQINALDGKIPIIPPKPKQLQSTEQGGAYRSQLLQQQQQQQQQDRFCMSETYSNLVGSRPGNYTGRSTRKSLQHDSQPNYAEVYVYTEPVIGGGAKDKNKLSMSVAERRYPQTEYTRIDHFKTEKFHDLIEQRKQEKSLAAASSTTALV